MTARQSIVRLLTSQAINVEKNDDWAYEGFDQFLVELKELQIIAKIDAAQAVPKVFPMLGIPEEVVAVEPVKVNVVVAEPVPEPVVVNAVADVLPAPEIVEEIVEVAEADVKASNSAASKKAKAAAK